MHHFSTLTLVARTLVLLLLRKRNLCVKVLSSDRRESSVDLTFLIATDAKGDVIVGNQLIAVIVFNDLSCASVVNPIAPIPDTGTCFGNLHSYVNSLCQTSTHRVIAEIETDLDVLHGNVFTTIGNCLSEPDRHFRQRLDRRLYSGCQLQPSFEYIGL